MVEYTENLCGMFGARVVEANCDKRDPTFDIRPYKSTGSSEASCFLGLAHETQGVLHPNNMKNT